MLSHRSSPAKLVVAVMTGIASLTTLPYGAVQLASQPAQLHSASMTVALAELDCDPVNDPSSCIGS